MAALSLQGIAKSYDGKTPVIHGVDLEIADGEFMVLVGPSGCGKSTVLRMIAGLEGISAGQLHIGGVLANDIAPAARRLAMVFQSYALYPHMTVYENMAFALKLAGHKPDQVRAAVERTADILQISALLKRRPKELSGGQRQRVAIGRAIVRKPEVFLFDEPLSNLDASLRVQMRVEISRLHKELGSTMVYVTHDQVEAMTLGQRIAVFNGGRIEQVGTPQQLYNQPANLFVAGFLGTPSMNFFPGEVVSVSANRASVRLHGGALIEVGADSAGAVPLGAGGLATIGVRAEHLSLHGAAEGNRVRLRVGHVEYLGDQSIVYGAVPGAPGLIAVRALVGQVPASGAEVDVHLPPTHCLLFDADGRSMPRTHG